MPSNVARFEQLMYLTIGIGIINSALQFQSFSRQAGAAFTLFVQAVVFAFAVLLIWLIARRRANWARWVLLVMFLIGVVPFIPILSKTLQTSPLSGVLSIVQFLAQGIALYLVFTGNAVAWFKRSPS